MLQVTITVAVSVAAAYFVGRCNESVERRTQIAKTLLYTETGISYHESQKESQKSRKSKVKPVLSIRGWDGFEFPLVCRS